MYSWTSVMSQRGVEVAPQIPMLSFPSSHVGSISLMSETSRDWGLTCRHSPKSTRPLELFFPQTNRIRSCRRANSLILGMRLATCRQMVSNDSNCPSGFSCLTYRIAAENNIEIIDATCPVVLQLQRKIKTAYDSNPPGEAQIVIYGKAGLGRFREVHRGLAAILSRRATV